MTYVLVQWHHFGVGNPGNVTRGKGQGLADVGSFNHITWRSWASLCRV